jgi:hypothetical protein
MKAVIKRLHSPDIDDLFNYVPSDPESFCFLLQVMAGPGFEEGEESFDIQVCTPKWLLENHRREDVIIGRHLLILIEYNYDRMLQTISSFISKCDGATWEEVAEKLSRLGKWEFEDYQEYKYGQA